MDLVGAGVGLVLAFWGFFHQLIVGGAATTFQHLEEKQARLIVMTWVAQGAFMSYVGLMTAALLFFFGSATPAVMTALLMTGIALVLLAAHVFVTGYSTFMGPIRTGAVLELTLGVYLLVLILLRNPLA